MENQKKKRSYYDEYRYYEYHPLSDYELDSLTGCTRSERIRKSIEEDY